MYQHLRLLRIGDIIIPDSQKVGQCDRKEGRINTQIQY